MNMLGMVTFYFFIALTVTNKLSEVQLMFGQLHECAQRLHVLLITSRVTLFGILVNRDTT